MPQQQQQPENLSFQSGVFAEVGKDSPDEKECDSAKVFCEVASYATTTTTRKFKLSIWSIC